MIKKKKVRYSQESSMQQSPSNLTSRDTSRKNLPKFNSPINEEASRKSTPIMMHRNIVQSSSGNKYNRPSLMLQKHPSASHLHQPLTSQESIVRSSQGNKKYLQRIAKNYTYLF